MNIAELKSKIILKDVPHILVFTGPETSIMCIYLAEIVNRLGLKRVNSSSVIDAIKQCSGKSILSEEKIFVVTDDLDFIKNEKAWENIESVLDNNYLVLKYHNLDSRLSFCKKFLTNIIVFEKLKENIIKKHLLSEYSLSEENLDKLVETCDCDFTKCKLELNKVYNLSKSKNITLDEAFLVCIDENILCSDFNANVFDFIKFVLTKQKDKYIKLYQSIRLANEQPLNVLSLLYNGFKNVLIAQTMESTRNIQQKVVKILDNAY